MIGGYWHLFARRLGDDSMEKFNPYAWYIIGTSLMPIYNSLQTDGLPLSSVVPNATTAQFALQALANADAKYIPLTGAKVRAREVSALLAKVLDTQRLQTDGQNEIPKDERGAIAQALVAFQTVFQTECAEMPSFIVSEHHGWNMAVMMENAEIVLSDMSRRALTPDEVRDIREAGRCLALDVPTGAAFHLYRLLESCVLKYMPALGVSLKPSDTNLGNYIKIIKGEAPQHKLAGPIVDTKVTIILEHIKDHYRNPGIHPGTFYTVDEADRQLALVKSVVHMIVEDIDDRLAHAFAWVRGLGGVK